MISLVGRQAEIARLDALAKEGAPIVTLWGPGGAGKTRLATELAARERARGRDVVFVDLASARTARDATLAIAAALGVEDAIAHAAGARKALVVADNLEQLDVDARAVVAHVADEGARVLATSREPLGDEREITIAIGPLPEDEALTLFDAVAGGATTSRDVALAIVKRLDALPLAIELAAARASLLGGDELLARLDRKLDVVATTTRDLPARHASLRAAIAWSWELLDADERDALRACATFEAPFDAALAEAVMGGSEDVVLGALERLRRRALLQTEPAPGRPRFRLLEAVRDFARGEIEHDALYTQHAAAIVSRCEPAADAVRRGADAVAELAQRRADLALAARRAKEISLAARAAIAASALLAVTGPGSEIVDLSTPILSATDLAAYLRARLLVARGDALRAIGDFPSATADVEHAIAVATATVHVHDQAAAARAMCVAHADALRVRGAISRTLGDSERAIEALDQAIAMYRELGERALEAIAMDEIGAAHQSAGRLSLAREKHRDAIAISVAEKSRRAEGIGRSHLAVATHRAGEPEAALPMHESALAIHRETGHRRLEGAEHTHIGFVLHELGRPGDARHAFERARMTLATAGARSLEALAVVLAARLAVDEKDPDTAAVLLASVPDLGSWPRLAATRLLVEGHLAFARGDRDAARRAYAASLASSTDVVAGFEALTPAYLALAGDASRLDDARARVRTFENPNLAVAFAILAGESHDPDARALATSSEVRRALAFVGTRRALRVSDGAKRILLPDGRAVDLSRRKNVVAVLAVLARERRGHPGTPVSADALLAAGWPGERMRAEAATKRLHTAIWTLRSLGLEGILLTNEAGYFLDPSIAAEIDL